MSLRLKLITTFVLLAAVLAPFQNCSSSNREETVRLASAGGEGYDGKPTFQSFGDCGDGKVSLKSKIEFNEDFTTAELKRDNCADLATPQSVDLAQVRHSILDVGAMVFQGKIYDLKRRSLDARKVTRKMCWTYASAGETREASVWFLGDALTLNAGVTPTLKGYVKRNAGAWTGKLGPISETAGGGGSYVYDVAPNASGDSMNLSVTSATGTGTLSYTISGAGGESQSALPMECYSQLAP